MSVGQKADREERIAPAAVVIGASAGAVDALSSILPRLPADYPLPIIVVVHLPPDRRSAIPELFQEKCGLEVHEADDKEPLFGGTVYFAPPDYHLLVETNRCLSLSSEEPVFHSRPSIDLLFESAADAFGAALIGVVLTGANSDGALGLRAIQQAGGTVLIERPELAYVKAMPLAALAACPDARIMSLEEIAAYLIEAAKYR
jgi:two-component system chemotaxis response regulator CheB